MRPLLLVACITFLAAESGIAQAPKDKSIASKGKKVDSLPGFKKFIIDGFTVLVRDDVLKEQDNTSYKRKPLECLEVELKLISRVMTKQQADTIRNNVQLWVEWDVREQMSNGRAGNAYGLYLGTHPRPIIIGKDPVYVSGVRILQMQGVTKRHQTEEAHDSVFLHEFAHAFHDLVLGYENQAIKDAFRQAMERKLYEKSTYLTTNEKEFFAELTCAYLDSLHQFPHNREELKKHDPASFKMLESMWGRRKDPKITAKDKPEFNLDLTLEGLRLGRPLTMATLTKEDLNGHPVLLSYWEPSWPDVSPSLRKLQSWHDELSDFGLVVLGEASWGIPNAVPIAEDTIARDKIRSGGITLPQFFNGTLKELDGFKTYPHALVFDHTGKCVYRGTLFGAEIKMRSALGKAIVAATEIEKFEPGVMVYVDALQKGQPLGPLLQKMVAYYRSESGANAEQTKALIKQITATGQKRLDDAEKIMKSEPLVAYERLEKLPITFKNTQLGAKATAMLTQLKLDKTVAAELRAKPSLDAVKKLDTTLGGKPGSFDPLQQRFRQDNADLITQLKDAVEKMKKTHSKTKALDEATAIAKRYGIEGK
ncbi:MAG: hypothetical protein K8T89_04890 [Planctomycetes bacterium]|nr:hypothetical protein [Planctomycetota bacterium]